MMRQTQPPSTWEIYSMQKQSKDLRSTFTVLPPAHAKTASQVSRMVSYKSPMSLTNPLAEYSLRLALSHTAKNPFRLN
jgi:hypothetical protein